MHYNAFISYKHAELDNKIAGTIERDLERYHIPFKVQKKTGYKKIERIFRDTDELPITSDLSGTIEEALRNADYLIVLCSTNTCKSMWVEREIKLFLQTHSQDKILTVIADGEPADVIPKILQNKEVKRINDHGVEETFIEPVEPLCCDYRLSKREAKRVELPRLVATLIGCSYNELMDRQRQYKMRRLTAIMSIILAIAVGFGAYMVYSNKKINESYQEALINQSKYLSNESAKYLDNEQRIAAVQLALAALPNEKTPDRPVVPEAIQAVTSASLAYVPESGSNITSVWNYTMPDRIDDYYIAAGGATLAAIDFSKNVKVWDTQTHDVIFEYSSLEKPVDDIFYLNSNTLLMKGTYNLIAVDVQNGKILWEKDSLDDNILGSYHEIIDDDSFLITGFRECLYKLSSKDGSVLDTYVWSDDPSVNCVLFKKMCISPSKDKIVFINDDNHAGKIDFCIYDLVAKECKTLDLVAENYVGAYDDLGKLKWLTDDTICLAIPDSSNNSNYGFLNMNLVSTRHINVLCLEPQSFTKKWEYDFSYTDVADGSGFLYIPDSDAVVYYQGNVCDVLDRKTGSQMYHFNTNDTIVNIMLPKGEELPTCFTRGGGMASANPKWGDDAVSIMTYFTDDLDKIIMSKGAYVRKRNSSEIIYYGVGVFDDDFTVFKDCPVYKELSAMNTLLDDNTLVLKYSADDGVHLAIFDTNAKELVRDVLLNEDSGLSYYYQLSGVTDEKVYISYIKDRIFRFLEVDKATGAIDETILSEDFSGSLSPMAFDDGKLAFYDDSEYPHKYIRVYDTATLKETKHQFAGDDYYYPNKLYFDAKTGIVYCSGTFDCIINTQTSEVIDVTRSATWGKTEMVHIDGDAQKIAISDTTDVSVLDFEGNELYKFSCPEVSPYGAVFHDDLLLVPYANGYLYRYNAQTGEYLERTEITYPGSSDYKTTFSFDDEAGLMYLQIGTLIDVIDKKSWTELAYLSQALGYHSKTDTFISHSYSTSEGYTIGYFKHYSLEELIEKANKLIEGAQISEDLKKAYGIG